MNISDWLDRISTIVSEQCSYFEDRQAQKRKLYIKDPDDLTLEYLIEQGYSRLGTNSSDNRFTRPECPHCRQCMSYRVRTADFKPSQNMKRVMKKNRDLEICWQTPQLTLSKARLYLKYRLERHEQLLKNLIDELPVLNFFYREPALEGMKHRMFSPVAGTLELTLRLDKRLVGFATFDRGKDALHALYSVYDTSLHHRSLGTEIILQGLQYATEQGIPYLYLGYYIPQHSKMNYKIRFKPGEIRDPFSGRWIDADEAVALINRAVNSKKF